MQILTDAVGNVLVRLREGSIVAELLSGARLQNSTLAAGMGDITVLIPSNLALTVQAVNESGGSGRINSDFPQVRPRAGGFPGAGPMVAEGALNGGGPMLRVNVTGGTIYLRRTK